MPHFHFELHITLVKFGEQPVHMTKRVMDVYLPIVHSLAYHMAKSYLDKGWRVERIECINFEWLPDDSLTWGD